MTTNETALIRFRVDETLKQRADAVCSERGFYLTDVLRAVVRRIAMEHAIPFELSAPAAADAPAPFAQYGKFLLDDLAHVKAESVIALLATFIANRARRIAGEKRKAKPNAKLIAKWEAENREAVQYHRVLNTRDSELVSKVEKRFTDLLAQGD